MAISDENKLMQEYVKRLFRIFRMLEFFAFSRFIIRKGKIIERDRCSVLYNTFIILILNLGAFIILWTSITGLDLLSPIELGTVLHFSIFITLLIIHITFGDKYRGPDLMQNCIEIDNFLGAEETKFMRDVTVNFFELFVVLVGIVQTIIVAYMYYVFDVSYTLHAIGSSYFFWILFAYDDYGFFLFSCLFLTTRARYLNVALLKITDVNIDTMPKQYLFHKLFWSNKNDDLVTFHTRAQSKDYSTGYRLLMKQLRLIETCYRFPITVGVITVIMGTFVTVQTFIMYIEVGTQISRATVLAGWAVLTWFYMVGLSLITDSFHVQVEQTKLLCAFVQLKPSSSAEILKLTKDVIATLELRDARVSLYNVFIFDTGLVFKFAVSTFMYITVQLQLAFPNLENKVRNTTKFDMLELNGNEAIEYLFLY